MTNFLLYSKDKTLASLSRLFHIFIVILPHFHDSSKRNMCNQILYHKPDFWPHTFFSCLLVSGEGLQGGWQLLTKIKSMPPSPRTRVPKFCWPKSFFHILSELKFLNGKPKYWWVLICTYFWYAHKSENHQDQLGLAQD